MSLGKSMKLEEFLKRNNFTYHSDKGVETVIMNDYTFYVVGTRVRIPIPLPTGKESLDDLVTMGTHYARASRLVQGIAMPVTYELKGPSVEVCIDFQSREELEQKLIKAIEGIESLRYFM
ncbi:MAG: hypothetical protein QXL04_04145 [Metallosphaera sp.]